LTDQDSVTEVLGDDGLNLVVEKFASEKDPHVLKRLLEALEVADVLHWLIYPLELPVHALDLLGSEGPDPSISG